MVDNHMTAQSTPMLPMTYLVATTTPHHQNRSILHMLNLEEVHIVDDLMLSHELAHLFTQAHVAAGYM